MTGESSKVVVLVQPSDNLFNNSDGEFINRIYLQFFNFLYNSEFIKKAPNYEFIILQDKLKNINYNSFTHIKELVPDKYRNNKRLRDNYEFNKIFNYRNQSLWDSLDLDLFDLFYNAMINIEYIRKINTKHNPNEYILFDKYGLLEKVIIETSSEYKIKYTVPRNNYLAYLKNYTKQRIRPHLVKIYEKIKDASQDMLFGEKSSNKFYDKSSKTKKIIFFSDEYRHADQIIPWSKELPDEIDLLVVGKRKKWGEYYSKNRISYRTFLDYSDSKLISRIRNDTKEHIKYWNQFKLSMYKKTNVEYKNIKLMKIIDSDLTYLFNKNLINVLANIILVERIIAVEEPDLVVTACDLHWFDKTCLLTSKKLNVKTLTIQHGMVNDSPIQESTVVDKIAIFGESSKRIYNKRGIEDKKLVITGRPIWDHVSNSKRPQLSRLAISKLGLDSSKKIVTFASQPFSREHREFVLKSVFKKISNNEVQFEFLNKTHPNEDSKLNYNLSRKYGSGKIRILEKTDIFEAINISDVWITVTSTTAIEASILGKPVILLDIPGLPNSFDNYEGLITCKVEDMCATLDRIFNDSDFCKSLDSSRKKFVEDLAFKQDGLASARVSNLIKEMVNYV